MIITRQDIVFGEQGDCYETHLFLGRYNHEIEKLQHILSKDEIELFNRFKVHSRRQEFIAGRFLAKTAAQLYHMNFSLQDISIVNGVWGFPVFKTREFAGMNVSIAHTKHYAACFLSGKNTHPIGIDIEEIMNENRRPLENFLSDYQNLSLVELHIYWAAKEALSKCLKTGFTIPQSVLVIESAVKNKNSYSIKFKFLKNVLAQCWVIHDLVICICYPSEWTMHTPCLKFNQI